MPQNPSLKQKLIKHLNDGNYKNWEFYVFIIVSILLGLAIDFWGSPR
jgi:hypothetical protein